MKRDKLELGITMRNFIIAMPLVCSLATTVLAEPPLNPELLNHGYCRACTDEMWMEVLPYLPRHEDGSLQGPIDDSTVMGIYRRLWNEGKGRMDVCLNSWAADRVGILVKNQIAVRALNKCQKRK